eukprot:TRINITY_DN15045_c0_g1_i3.p3 TRINITY_DN15045_c0_g1~~TRINITY_DN15045_c0_g1_i3.p3  ORF type:complete len:128 (-),score=19.43 TRINITY_DN15045_c0_g1_i3:82-465(-)
MSTLLTILSSGQTLGVKAQRFRGHTSPHRNVKEKLPQGQLSCGCQEFISTQLFDPSMSTLLTILSSGQTLGVKAQRFRGHTSPHRNVKEKLPQGQLTCGCQEFISTQLFDPSMSSLLTILMQNSESV